jgi:hypothetical protein
VDVVLSSDDDDNATHMPEHDVLIERKVYVVDDVEGMGPTSAEALILGPIGAGMPGNSRPPAADRGPTVPPWGTCGCKRLRHAVKRSNLVHRADQVMSQVKLPPYCGPHNPLDLVAFEIVFGHMFEVFH